MTGRRTLAPLLAAAALLAASCSGSDGDAAPTTTAAPTSSAPGSNGSSDSSVEGVGAVGGDWETVAPGEVGLDAAVLDELAATAEAEESTCLLVARDGRIAGEWYFGDGAVDRPQEVFSATKTYTGILVGIAQDDGALDIDDPASNYIEDWKGTDSEPVTVRNLISNDSGRSWSLAQDYNELVRAADKTGFAVGLDQEQPPGDTWAYNNAAIQSLDQVISVAVDQPTAEFGQERLLDPLGMDDSHFTTDSAGGTLTFMGLRSTCRDMARFGQMLLQDGTWAGEQIVSADYVAEATEPSQDLNVAYGFLTWLNVRGHLAGAVSPVDASMEEERPDAQLVDGAPEHLFWAQGLGGQIIQVDRETGTVVVRLGSASMAAGFGPADTARVVTDAVTD